MAAPNDMSSDDKSAPVTDAWGIDDRFLDASGTLRTIAPEVLETIRERIGTPPDDRPPRPLVTRPGEPVPDGHAYLVLEDGSTREVADFFPADLPYGYHAMIGSAGRARRLILGPGRAHLPERRMWGWAAQVYAMRSARSWGMGDLEDLRRLARWSSRELGAGFVLVNPVQAVSPTTPQQSSPYYPASRRFLNPLYLAVENVPGAAAVPEVEHAAQAGRALNADPHLNRDEVWRLKLGALVQVWAIRRRDPCPDFEAWMRTSGPSLHEFATWCVLCEEFGPGWRSWPTPLRTPKSSAVTAFAAGHADRIEFYCWLQWLTQRQLKDASRGIALIQDMPIGVDPGGFDAWAWQELLAEDLSVGAPPDEFNTKGQDWGLPPFVPWRLVDAAYQPFIETVRASMTAGGGLRVDHVMGLFRLWWVPGGASPTDGAYVRYPSEDLLDIVALESWRAQALVVGEDLGTVEPGVREAMAERGILSYRLLWFESDEPASWPEQAMAAVTTHDLPTVAGLWTGSDLDEQRQLGMDPNEEGTTEIRDRLAAGAGLADDASVEDAVAGAYGLLAETPSLLLTVALDDVAGAADRPNIPGADGGRPNWSVPLPVDLAQLEHRPLVREVVEKVRAATDPPEPPAPA
ncbi:4-alpha-glucanotransferase [Sporichthya polymorpha]|uniref:4-alpha-glucanotransferase n=1 Tax=Sporichthya polymorpha TaxID=35751 RepID=UPI00039F59D6|nr:4-alpha-glucanotransferase [Sporichthya polymorpha]